jgi:hypothetical protein
MLVKTGLMGESDERKITVVAIDMGYGHLRPAHALAGLIGTDVLECDKPPLAGVEEQATWARTRRFYEAVSRLSTTLSAFRGLLDAITDIPHLHPRRDLSDPSVGARGLASMVSRGLGRGLARYLDEGGRSLLTTFYAPAIAADLLGKGPVHCVVTDSDVNRVWAPLDGTRSRIQYFAPSRRVVRRLEAYGVRPENIRYTGYPLPDELVGGRDRTLLRKNLAARLSRLDPRERFIGQLRTDIERRIGRLPKDDRPPLVTFAVGGAGAQAELADRFLPSLREALAQGKLRLALVAGIRPKVAARFRAALARSGVDNVLILLENDVPSYLRAFNALLAETDVLWTKPSEMTFFAALGLPIVFSSAIGVHEGYNRRWAIEAGAGFAQGNPSFASGWLGEWIADGTLAGAAWSGALRLPSLGLYEIAAATVSPPSRAAL